MKYFIVLKYFTGIYIIHFGQKLRVNEFVLKYTFIRRGILERSHPATKIVTLWVTISKYLYAAEWQILSPRWQYNVRHRYSKTIFQANYSRNCHIKLYHSFIRQTTENNEQESIGIAGGGSSNWLSFKLLTTNGLQGINPGIMPMIEWSLIYFDF